MTSKRDNEQRKFDEVHKNKKPRRLSRGFYNSWHRAIFPGGLPPSIVAAVRLYRRVRDGNGCVPVARAPRTFRVYGAPHMVRLRIWFWRLGSILIPFGWLAPKCLRSLRDARLPRKGTSSTLKTAIEVDYVCGQLVPRFS